jgi:hypothetical protein
MKMKMKMSGFKNYFRHFSKKIERKIKIIEFLFVKEEINKNPPRYFANNTHQIN